MIIKASMLHFQGPFGSIQESSNLGQGKIEN